MTPYLHGNGKPCRNCHATGFVAQTRIPCPCCNGTGIVARAIEDVICETLRDARQLAG